MKYVKIIALILITRLVQAADEQSEKNKIKNLHAAVSKAQLYYNLGLASGRMSSQGSDLVAMHIKEHRSEIQTAVENFYPHDSQELTLIKNNFEAMHDTFDKKAPTILQRDRWWYCLTCCHCTCLSRDEAEGAWHPGHTFYTTLEKPLEMGKREYEYRSGKKFTLPRVRDTQEVQAVAELEDFALRRQQQESSGHKVAFYNQSKLPRVIEK